MVVKNKSGEVFSFQLSIEDDLYLLVFYHNFIRLNLNCNVDTEDLR